MKVRCVYHLATLSISILTAIFPGEPGLAGCTGANNDISSGDNWSYVQSSSQIITISKPIPKFLQAG